LAIRITPIAEWRIDIIGTVSGPDEETTRRLLCLGPDEKADPKECRKKLLAQRECFHILEQKTLFPSFGTILPLVNKSWLVSNSSFLLQNF